MSYVHFFIAKDDCLYFVTLPHKDAIKFARGGFRGLLRTLKPLFLDSGYVVLDLNRRIVINAQSKFPLISKDCLKNFEVYQAAL